MQLNETVDLTTVAIFYAEDIAAGANTVTVSDSITGGTLRFAIFEYSGVATTASDDLVIGAISTSESATFTAGTDYVIQERVPATGTKLVVEDRRQATPGAVSANATLSVSRIWGAAMATFKRAP